MTLYSAFELDPARPPIDTSSPETAPGAHVVFGDAGLDRPAADVLAALFDADGATPTALSVRVRTSPDVVAGALGTLHRLGYVERDGNAEWLTGAAFGLRRSVRRAGERGAVPFERA